MKQGFFLLTVSFLLGSCATLSRKGMYDMRINTNAENAKVVITGSIYSLPATVRVKRSGKDLDVRLITDTNSFDYTIRPSVNPAFLFGNLLWVYAAPAAYLVDLTNEKRFYYGKSVFLNVYDTASLIRTPVSKSFRNYFSKTYPDNKGRQYLQLSLPYVNAFNLKPAHEARKINTGFWGIHLGLDHWYADDAFLNVGISGITDHFVPVPVGASMSGEFEKMNSLYGSFANNHKISRLSLGYGISYALNTWHLRYYDRYSAPPPSRTPVKRTHSSLGLIFPVHFQLLKQLHLGIIYRPGFFTPNQTHAFTYEHTISWGISWKIIIKKREIR